MLPGNSTRERGVKYPQEDFVKASIKASQTFAQTLQASTVQVYYSVDDCNRKLVTDRIFAYSSSVKVPPLRLRFFNDVSRRHYLVT
ncbi:unnamed protein product [Acanthoscelides obtectus]|uniref:Uncharacterized protein n=1 Tax=Acanthoscelides obtectus TaxID=200917 RepID=A0A9P0NUD5_ACAOB|nr:unnamed protein product [Acanthoscelides obtectus]CAK1639900.1 hypothetical protein AOBTE_LOCUS11439 [Acanthoscelides obtectus]